VDAFSFETKRAGINVVTEGEPGDKFYILDSGQCEVVVNKGQKVVLQLSPGDAFGELALMYDVPRAATVRSITEVGLWVLDRASFNYILKDVGTTKRKLFSEYLARTELLASLSAEDRGKLADVLVEETYRDGSRIFREGDQGICMYIVAEGAVAIKKTSKTGENTITTVGPGGCFGERALLRDEARAASAVAEGKAKVLRLDKAAFIRLLGPCKTALEQKQTTDAQSAAGVHDTASAAAAPATAIADVTDASPLFSRRPTLPPLHRPRPGNVAISTPRDDVVGAAWTDIPTDRSPATPITLSTSSPALARRTVARDFNTPDLQDVAADVGAGAFGDSPPEVKMSPGTRPPASLRLPPQAAPSASLIKAVRQQSTNMMLASAGVPVNRETLASLGPIRQFPRGEYIVREGNVVGMFCILIEGAVVAYQYMGKKQKVAVRKYVPGDYLTSLALVDQPYCSVRDLVTTQPSKIQMIEPVAWNRFLRSLITSAMLCGPAVAPMNGMQQMSSGFPMDHRREQNTLPQVANVHAEVWAGWQQPLKEKDENIVDEGVRSGLVRMLSLDEIFTE